MKRKNILLTILVWLGLLSSPLVVKADWAGCHMSLNENRAYSDGEIITLDLGSKGVTSNQSISGFHYHILYDPEILEPIPYENGGVGSYHGWEKIYGSTIIQNGSRFKVREVDVLTNDKSKFLTSTSSDIFVKLGYAKFRVKNTNQSSTTLTLKQTYEEDRANGFKNGSTSSYKYIWLYDPQTNEHYKLPNEDPEYDYQEWCKDTITTYVSLYKKAYINNIIINNSVIKDYDKNVYNYNLTYTTKTINIEANTVDGYNITGDLGKKTLNYGNNTFKLQVTSSTGDKKEYTLNINYPDTRNDDNTLKTLTLSTGIIDFKSEQNVYDLEVDYNVDKIKIDSTLTNSKASYVKDFGNREVNLEVGKNEILIKVKSQKGIENIYTINIIRNESTDTCDIKDLKINGYNLNFDTLKTNYTLTIDYEVSKLDIDIILVNEESSYKISGNENLTNGSLINIKVTDKNGKEKEYNINIIKDMTVVEKKKNKSIIIIFSTIMGIGVLTAVGVLIYKNKIKSKIENNIEY